jgi:thiol-disulfide isomerase/thioredoxin
MAKNDITGDSIKTKASSQAYRDGWDLIFNKKNMKKLILATATWCGPCVMMKSKLDKEKILDKVEIIDADEDVEDFNQILRENGIEV